jgi:hypothetical protein
MIDELIHGTKVTSRRACALHTRDPSIARFRRGRVYSPASLERGTLIAPCYILSTYFCVS